MAKSKAKSKSKKSPQHPSTTPRTKFVLTPDHKRFLAKRAEEHATANHSEKPGIVAKAINELLAEYSVTHKDDVQEAKKVCFAQGITFCILRP